MAGEDDHLEQAYEDRYTVAGDWEAEDEGIEDEERDSDEELLDTPRPAGYQGRHRAAGIY